MSAIAGATAQEILPVLKEADSNINAVSFMYGKSTEFVETIMQMDKAASSKYRIWPLIMLFTDITTVTNNRSGSYSECSLQMALAYPTSHTYKADERYTKSYEPILYPLWRRLIQEIAESGCFAVMSEKDIEYTKYDRLYWGKQGNTLSAVVDAIELQNIRLKIIKGAQPRLIDPAGRFHDALFFDGEFFQ